MVRGTNQPRTGGAPDHKIANVLNKFPKSMQPAVKADLREIWQAETRAAAEAAMDTFAAKYGAKYEKGGDLPDQGPRRVARSTGLRRASRLLRFLSPADHWDHLRTLPGLRPFGAETRHRRVSGTPLTPIESVFATVRHRTVRTKGALSQKTAKLMVFKLVQAAGRHGAA